MNTFPHSIAKEILSKMAIGASLVVLLITGLAYSVVYKKAEEAAVDNLKRFVWHRTQQEAALFRLAEDNLQAFKKEYLMLYQMAPAIGAEEFDWLFFRDEQGATRMKKEFFDGKVTPDGAYRSGMSGFLGNNLQLINDDLKRRLILGYRLIAAMGPGSVTRFANLHATFPENAIILYWPAEPWGLQARANLMMTDGAVVKATLQQYNPERKAVWTGLYYDLTANEWTITYELPIDYEGRHLITPSHDVLLNDLVERLISDHLEGSYNYIVSPDGNLIAHPQKLDVIKQKMGVINLEKLGDPMLSNMFTQISRSGDVTPEVKIIDDPVNNTYLAVAKLAGPDWWFVTVYPKDLISSKAHNMASGIIALGMMVFCCMMLIVLYVIRRNVATPVKALKTAAEQITAGNYQFVSDEKWQELENTPNEIGLLIKTFNHMAVQIRDANKILEDTIEQRTQDLEAANAKLVALSFLDGLTGVQNRRAFDQAFRVAFTAAKYYGERFALLICDIDYFKLYNDCYGHEAGDRALKETAEALVRAVGEHGNVYRYGGEEFAVILYQEPFREQAVTLLKAVEELNSQHCKSPYGILTISAGLVVYDDSLLDEKSLFIAADANLYASKEAGRNRLT